MNRYEEAEGRALIEWAMYVPIVKDFLFHVPNGGKRSRGVAGAMKAQGVRKGVHDYMLPVRRGGYAGLWIELKPPRHTGYAAVSKEQRAWKVDMIRNGYASFVAYGADQAMIFIRWYLALPVPDDAPECPTEAAVLVLGGSK